MVKQFNLILGPVLAIVVALLGQAASLEWQITATMAVTALMVVWWVSEALPIPITSLVPFILFPALGVLDYQSAASALGNHLIVLLMGAFMLSLSIEKSGVHKRFALSMVNWFGAHSPKRVVFGFMTTAALLSMWISNTATVLMLLPIMLSVIAATQDRRFAVVLLLGVAYAASLGGAGTPIGTPPNVIFIAVYQDTFGIEYSFLDWMKIGIPAVLLGVPLIGSWLVRGLRVGERLHLPAVGEWQIAEKRVLMIFLLVVAAWVFRKAPWGGWSGFIGTPQIGDSTIALAGVLLMCLVRDGKKGFLLDWKTASKIPWGVLLLFAGGICLAKAYQASGLSQLLGEHLTELSGLPIFFMILLICLAVTFLTEVTSNTATTTLLMPILAVASQATGMDARLFMIPAAISASCAFMLPVATAPNTIVYGTGKFSIATMAREGIVLNLIMAVVIATVCYVLIT